MADPWTFAGKPATLDTVGGVVTLVDESTFAISSRSGDIIPGSAQGLFVRDTRVISRFELLIDGQRLEPLAATSPDPFAATFVARGVPATGAADSSLLVFRSRYVGQGMREDVTIHNYASEPAVCLVEGFVDADFADLFAVKEGRAADPDGETWRSVEGNTLAIGYRRGGTNRGVRLRFTTEDGGDAEPGRNPRGVFKLSEDLVTVEVVVPAAGHWSGCVEVTPVIESAPVHPRYRCGQPVERATPSERLARWRQRVPHVDTDHDGLRTVMARSAEDLGALRIFDPDFPDRVVVAAGAPWFMTVFGRDSLLTAWSALLVDPDLALGVLQTLARFQGEDVDPLHDEQPGRILHEMRFGEAASLSLGGGSIYYGTADATPLFVMLLGELRRWGLGREQVDELLPNADRALAWIRDFGDADGDGYVEYHRATSRGLANQGWKDSWDGIRYADGQVAQAPIALCEVQAYVYGAYLARAHFAFETGDRATYDSYQAKARALKRAFNRDFWLDDREWFAVGLDADKRPIDSLTSNMGHCLWTGIVDEDKAHAVAKRLLGPEMFTGWGIRTLATTMGGYNPVSYHCGSVWPHDTAIAAAGLARYGFEEGAQRLVMSLIDAGTAQGGRLPELFAGLGRDELAVPAGYPTSCSPQAWAAASPLLCLRTLLRFDPWVPYGKTWLAPMVPEQFGSLRVEGIPLAGARVDVEVRDGTVRIDGLPKGIELIRTPRHPVTAV
ncbi:MAG TPA: glycogen debranching N-terminal domain-containing protein [Acidimicrobiales bacterium]|nr:glycogen debranching N-terminal domain-containing protein [Acidimicrobiales bacterium]